MRQRSADDCMKVLSTSVDEDSALFFNPTRHVLEYQSGSFNLKRKPLYPGYVFVQCNREVLNALHSNKPAGYYGPVRLGEEIVPVQNEEIDKIRELGDRNGNVGVSYGVLEGDRVKITSGPLKDREGYVVKLSKRKHRATILIPMGEKKIKLELACIVNAKDDVAA